MDWYVIQAYSGYEQKVKAALLERITLNNLSQKFGEILIPTEQIVELKGGAKALKGKSPLVFRAVFEVANKSEASKLEYAVKKMSRLQKDNIINKGQLNELPCIKSQFDV